MAPAALLQDSYPLGEPGMSHWAHMKTTLAFLAAFGFPCWAHPRRAVGGGAGGMGRAGWEILGRASPLPRGNRVPLCGAFCLRTPWGQEGGRSQW